VCVFFFKIFSSLELEKTEFVLGSVINAVVSQVMILLQQRNLQLIRDIPEETKTLAVCGDQVRLQQILAEFLVSMVRCTPSTDGWVEIHVRPRLKQIANGENVVYIEFRYAATLCLFFSCTLLCQFSCRKLTCWFNFISVRKSVLWLTCPIFPQY